MWLCRLQGTVREQIQDVSGGEGAASEEYPCKLTNHSSDNDATFCGTLRVCVHVRVSLIKISVFSSEKFQ